MPALVPGQALPSKSEEAKKSHDLLEKALSTCAEKARFEPASGQEQCPCSPGAQTGKRGKGVGIVLLGNKMPGKHRQVKRTAALGRYIPALAF